MENRFKNRTSKLINRIIALIVVFTFIIYDISWACNWDFGKSAALRAEAAKHNIVSSNLENSLPHEKSSIFHTTEVTDLAKSPSLSILQNKKDRLEEPLSELSTSLAPALKAVESPLGQNIRRGLNYYWLIMRLHLRTREIMAKDNFSILEKQQRILTMVEEEKNTLGIGRLEVDFEEVISRNGHPGVAVVPIVVEDQKFITLSENNGRLYTPFAELQDILKEGDLLLVKSHRIGDLAFQIVRVNDYQRSDIRQTLAELLSADDFSETVVAKASRLIANILVQQNITISKSETKKLALVLRQLFLRPDTKSRKIAESLRLNAQELIGFYRIVKQAKILQDVLVTETPYARFVHLLTNTLNYKDRLEKIFKGQPVYPVIVEWHPGETCDSNCIFCYSKNMRYRDRKLGRKPISLDKVKQLIAEIAQNEVREMWFSGGKEPLTNPVTPEAIKAAVNAGLVVRLYTNGIRLNEETRQAVLGCKQVRVSINAATPEVYTQVQGINGDNFNKVIANLKALVELKKQTGAQVNIGVSFLLNPFNYRQMIQMADLLTQIGIDFFAIRTEMVGTIRRFNDEEIAEILKQNYQLKRYAHQGRYGQMKLDIRSVNLKDLAGEKHYEADMEKAKICKARFLKMGMSPYGIFYMCEYCEHPRNARDELEIGDLTKQSFKEILERSVSIKHNPAECEACMIDEFGTNIMLEKLMEDMAYGIPLIEQPYVINNLEEMPDETHLDSKDPFADAFLVSNSKGKLMLNRQVIYALEKALARSPELVVEVDAAALIAMDEGKARLRNLIQRLQFQGTGIMDTEHDLNPRFQTAFDCCS